MGTGSSTSKGKLALKLAAQLAAEQRVQEQRVQEHGEIPEISGEDAPSEVAPASKPKQIGKEQLKPSVYQKSRWEKKYGKLFENVLKGGAQAPVRLIDAHWLVALIESREAVTFGYRQTLPEEAFVSLDECIMFGCPSSLLAVICVSYPWLSPAHPDPHGAHCAILAIALRALINEKADAGATLTGPSGTQRYGVFIDFCSLFQHPDPSAGVFRTPEEDARFKLALSTLSALYSALGTNVLRLTVLPKDYPNGYDLPEGSNVAQYDDRGWCYTEGRWAALTKPATATFDLGRLRDLGTRAVPASREELVELCAQGGVRRPPLLPAAFAEALQQKAFTNGKDDRPLVEALYRQEFESTFRNVHVLRYQALGWGDEEILLVASALDAVVEPGDRKHKTARAHRATPLNELYLMGNTFGDAAAQPLLDVCSRLRGLTWLNLSDNPKLGDGTFTHLAKLLGASRGNFKRLQTVKLCGCTSATQAGKQALVKACEARKIRCVLEEDRCIALDA